MVSIIECFSIQGPSAFQTVWTLSRMILFFLRLRRYVVPCSTGRKGRIPFSCLYVVPHYHLCLNHNLIVEPTSSWRIRFSIESRFISPQPFVRSCFHDRTGSAEISWIHHISNNITSVIDFETESFQGRSNLFSVWLVRLLISWILCANNIILPESFATVGSGLHSSFWTKL